jgi:hypothetical protein
MLHIICKEFSFRYFFHVLTEEDEANSHVLTEEEEANSHVLPFRLFL